MNLSSPTLHTATATRATTAVLPTKTGGTVLPPTVTRTPTASKTPTRTRTHTGTPPTSTPSRVPTQQKTATLVPTATPNPGIGANETWRFYYYAGSQRIAVRVKSSTQDQLYYLFSDHLGSLHLTVDTNTTITAGLRYFPFGANRVTYGAQQTALTFTGQRADATTGLYFFQSRWYDGSLGRFTSPDTLIPEPGSPLAWDRYAYVNNSPIMYSDPSGHCPWCILIGVLVFIATIPGDTGPYEVDPTTVAVGEAGLRMADPMDWIYTGADCLSGNCTGTDILFGILPIVNGGMDDVADAAKHLDNVKVKPGSLSNTEARKWYLTQEAGIKNLIDKSLPLEEQAKRAFELRNQYRTQARELMADREWAEKLNQEEPNLTWEQVTAKGTSKGYTGDNLYQYIIDSSMRSRQSVNDRLGLE